MAEQTIPMQMPPRPMPFARPETQPFWDALRQGKVMIQRCQTCGEYIFYPRSFCPEDGSDKLEWVEISGRGTVLTYSVAMRHPDPNFAPECPFTLAVIQLEEGPALLSRFEEGVPQNLRVGQKVQIVPHKLTDEWSLPYCKALD